MAHDVGCGVKGGGVQAYELPKDRFEGHSHEA